MTATPASRESEPLADAARCIIESLGRGGTLFLAGNGGSHADALHIAGELEKDFERPRPLDESLRQRIAGLGAPELAEGLQQGLAVHVLGTNPVLTSAVDNDLALRHVGLAQELCARVRPGDVLLAISTSGRSRNVIYAAVVARALDAAVIALTGPAPGPLADRADVVVVAPGVGTAEVQTNQVAIYHELCRRIEQGCFA